jgi:hypothetical protein
VGGAVGKRNRLIMAAGDRAVAIVGATGVTGGYAFDAAEAFGLNPIAFGRDRTRLTAFLQARGLSPDRLRVVDVRDETGLRAAFADVATVISTVAPFKQNGFVIAKAAAELGLGYTDPSGEGGFIAEVIDKLDGTASRTGATLCPGNGTSAFLGDIAIHSILDETQDRVGAVLYDIQNYTPSWGSLQSYLTSILPSGGARIRAGEFEIRPFADYAGRVCRVNGYLSIVPDPLIVSRYWRPQKFDAMAKQGRLPRSLVRLVAASLNDTWLSKALLTLPFDRWLAYDPAGDAKSSVTVYAEVGPGNGTLRRRVVRGTGIYPLTGRILAATAKVMIEQGSRPAGVRAASEMFASFDQALALTGAEALD